MTVYGKNAGPNFTVTDGNGNEIVLSTAVQSDGSNALVTVAGGTPPASAATTPVAGDSHSIVAGGTAQNAFAALEVVTGGFIRNPYNATESLYVDIVNAAQVSQSGGTNGTSVELQPGDTFYLLPSTIAVSVNAATTAHAFVAVRY